MTEPKTPVGTPRPPSFSPPPNRRDHREEEDEWMEEKKEIAERGWWQSHNQMPNDDGQGSSSDLAAMDARSMGPSKLTLSGMSVTISRARLQTKTCRRELG